MHAASVPTLCCAPQGLGKTIQVIALLAYLAETRGVSGPFLVAAPASVLPNWEAEFRAWAPALRLTVYRGNASERAGILTSKAWPGPFSALYMLHTC